jgi:uncharacterized protein YycO
MMHTDNVAILSPKNIDSWGRLGIVDFCRSQIGKPYDYELNSESNENMYCSELVAKAINAVTYRNYLSMRERFGLMTITPQDLYEATKKFDRVWEKRKK